MARKRKRSTKGLGSQGTAAIKRAASPRLVIRVPTKPKSQPRGLDALLAPPRRHTPVVSKRRERSEQPLDVPRQRALFQKPRKSLLRGPTRDALSDTNKKQTRDPARMSRVLRDAICNDYNKSKRQQRSVMFASGSAGKGRRNPGPRKPDWRKEICG